MILSTPFSFSKFWVCLIEIYFYSFKSRYFYSFVASDTTGNDFLMLRHFSLSMNREFDLILRSCSSLALFCSRSCKHMVLSVSLVTARGDAGVLFVCYISHVSLFCTWCDISASFSFLFSKSILSWICPTWEERMFSMNMKRNVLNFYDFEVLKVLHRYEDWLHIAVNWTFM